MIHNDEPTLIDALDRTALLTEVGYTIAHCQPPHVFGIHGDWGLGKTSFLHQLQLHLTGRCPQQTILPPSLQDDVPIGSYQKHVAAVWFDAWRYQHDDSPIVALLHELRSQLSWAHQLTTSIKKQREIAIRGALLSIEDLTKKIGFQYSKFTAAKQHWEATNLAATLPSHTLREHLREAIERLLPKSKSPTPRLVVFVDDVDRCEPDIAYSLLEGLKVYLTLDNCVFVLGMNRKAVADALARRFHSSLSTNPAASPTDEMSSSSMATAYMEKICQNVWQLPIVTNPQQTLHQFLSATVQHDRTRTLILKSIEGIPCLPPNPRRLKGLANTLGRLASRLPEMTSGNGEETTILDARMLVIVAYVYHFHPELYVRWEAELDFYKVIRDFCRGSPSPAGVLDTLILPKVVHSDQRTAVPELRQDSAYPDPADARVFWVQSLILSLETVVGPDQFRPFLRDGES